MRSFWSFCFKNTFICFYVFSNRICLLGSFSLSSLSPILHKKIKSMAPWYCGYHYCTTSFNKVWTQVLRRFKSCSRRVGDSRWWGSLKIVPGGNKAWHLSLVNHTTINISLSIHHSSNLLISLWNVFTKCNNDPCVAF